MLIEFPSEPYEYGTLPLLGVNLLIQNSGGKMNMLMQAGVAVGFRRCITISWLTFLPFLFFLYITPKSFYC